MTTKTITDTDQCIRIAHMLLRQGIKIGLGHGKDAGLVFYALDGKAYAVSGDSITTYDYESFRNAIREGEILCLY